jgi:hypothetical protein
MTGRRGGPAEATRAVPAPTATPVAPADAPARSNDVPFAHCIDCGSSALIDPSGRCPEGHTVGAAGARVAAAIGSATPHPDEPQPWVHQVQLAPEVVDAAPPEPRTVRPPSVPTAPEPERFAGPRADQAATDDLMRELHALGDLGGFADVDGPAPAATTPRLASAPTPAPAPVHLAPEAPVAPVAPATPAAPPTPTSLEDTTEIVTSSVRPLFPAPAVRAGVPAPPSSPEEATDLSSLANLAAAVRSLDEREAETPGHLAAPAPTGHAAPAPTGHLAAPAPTGHLAAPAPTGPATASIPAPGAHTQAPPPPLFPAPAPSSVAAPVAAPAPAPPPAADVAVASPFDGSFTARGDRPRRADARTAKKGLFRR